MARGTIRGMCNLYLITKGHQAIPELYRAATDRTGNLPSMPGVLPDYPAPIVRNGPDGCELVKALGHAVSRVRVAG